MPQLNPYTWNFLPIVLVLFFGINWIFFNLYIRSQSKIITLFFSYLQYNKLLFGDLLLTIYTHTATLFNFFLWRQNIEYKFYSQLIKKS